MRAAGNNAIASIIMHLTCPQCHTEYDVPDAALIGRSRTLRCSDCGTKFTAPALPEPVIAAPEPAPELPPQEAIIEAPAPPEEAESEAGADASFEPEQPAIVETAPETGPEETMAPLSASRDIPAPPKFAAPAPSPAAARPNRALGISVLVVLLLIGIVLAEHRAIGHAWPPSLRLFNALGLH